MDIIIGFSFNALCALWVYFDASKRDWSSDKFANRPWKWAVGTMFLWLIAFPVYVLRRGKRPRTA